MRPADASVTGLRGAGTGFCGNGAGATAEEGAASAGKANAANWGSASGARTKGGRDG